MTRLDNDCQQQVTELPMTANQQQTTSKSTAARYDSRRQQFYSFE